MSEHKLLMMRDGACLRPYGDVAYEDFGTVRRGKPVTVTVHEPRNPEHLKLYWTLATKVADFCDDFHDKDDADFWVRSHMPWMLKEFVLGDGRVAVRVKSIALESMSQQAFTRFFDRATFLWSQKIGCDPETLLEQARDAA